MVQTQAKVLYQNVLRTSLTSGGLVFAPDAGVDDNPAGFPPQNLTDWRDFSLYRVSGTGTGGDISGTFGAAVSVNSVGIYARVPQGVGESFSVTISVTISAVPNVLGVFAFGDTGTASDMNPLRMLSFTQKDIADTDSVEVTIIRTAGLVCDIRQIAIGLELEFPRGQHVGMTPTVNQGGIIRKNIISVNGSIIASNVRRVEKRDTIDLDYLEPDWVRTTWNAFSVHATRYPFFRKWNPTQYPLEVDWCAAEGIELPTNAHRKGKMAVSMPLYCLAR